MKELWPLSNQPTMMKFVFSKSILELSCLGSRSHSTPIGEVTSGKIPILSTPQALHP